jgi:hypothetical protein
MRTTCGERAQKMFMWCEVLNVNFGAVEDGDCVACCLSWMWNLISKPEGRIGKEYPVPWRTCITEMAVCGVCPGHGPADANPRDLVTFQSRPGMGRLESTHIGTDRNLDAQRRLVQSEKSHTGQLPVHRHSLHHHHMKGHTDILTVWEVSERCPGGLYIRAVDILTKQASDTSSLQTNW